MSFGIFYINKHWESLERKHTSDANHLERPNCRAISKRRVLGCRIEHLFISRYYFLIFIYLLCYDRFFLRKSKKTEAYLKAVGVLFFTRLDASPNFGQKIDARKMLIIGGVLNKSTEKLGY